MLHLLLAALLPTQSVAICDAGNGVYAVRQGVWLPATVQYVFPDGMRLLDWTDDHR